MGFGIFDVRIVGGALFIRTAALHEVVRLQQQWNHLVDLCQGLIPHLDLHGSKSTASVVEVRRNHGRVDVQLLKRSVLRSMNHELLQFLHVGLPVKGFSTTLLRDLGDFVSKLLGGVLLWLILTFTALVIDGFAFLTLLLLSGALLLVFGLVFSLLCLSELSFPLALGSGLRCDEPPQHLPLARQVFVCSPVRRVGLAGAVEGVRI
mmetsp:Transcript_42548/g.79347  ORF Transcript_42548/g.79347 Transcript_42548/m.79347 type:complete len:206 (-) Transcript_42548:149-766(-)